MRRSVSSMVGNIVENYGGLNKTQFTYLTEKAAPYIRDYFQPKISFLTNGELHMILPFRKEFVGNIAMPCLHGGVCATLIDHVGGFTGWSSLEHKLQRMSTIDMRIDYLHPAPCEDLFFDGLVVHRSNRLCRVDVICWNQLRTKKLAIGRCLYNIYESKDDST
eukprot:gene14481-19438_t